MRPIPTFRVPRPPGRMLRVPLLPARRPRDRPVPAARPLLPALRGPPVLLVLRGKRSMTSEAPATGTTQRTVRVRDQRQLARDTFLLRLECPDMARHAVPGQFFMVRAPGETDPLLGRPFALYDTWLDAAGEPAGIDIVYLVLGKMTRLMRNWRAGDAAEVWGPLGNGFPLSDASRLLLVAGGIGQTPFLAVAREALGLRGYGVPARIAGNIPRVGLCYGVRNAAYLAGVEDFEQLGVDVHLSTDDGSHGHHGYVTDLLLAELNAGGPVPHVYCCGPEPMLRAVSRLTAEHGVPCWLSLETPMACGFGACFSCVTRVRQDDGGWDYRRVCVEGPIFPAQRLMLDEPSPVQAAPAPCLPCTETEGTCAGGPA